MTEKSRQIIALGGGGFYRDSENLALERYIMQQTNVENPKVAFVPTASGEPDVYVVSFFTVFLQLGCRPSRLSFFKRTPDLRSYLLSQDVIYVGGGNTKSMLAVWRDWGVPEQWRQGLSGSIGEWRCGRNAAPCRIPASVTIAGVNLPSVSSKVS